VFKIDLMLSPPGAAVVNTIIQVDPQDLRPVIEAVVNETLARLETERAKLTGKLAYTETGATRLLYLRFHRMRDESRCGRSTTSMGPEFPWETTPPWLGTTAEKLALERDQTEVR